MMSGPNYEHVPEIDALPHLAPQALEGLIQSPDVEVVVYAANGVTGLDQLKTWAARRFASSAIHARVAEDEHRAAHAAEATARAQTVADARATELSSLERYAERRERGLACRIALTNIESIRVPNRST